MKNEVRGLFFAGLDQIDIEPIRGRGEKFLDKYYITTDRKTIVDLINPYLSGIGSVEYGWLTNQSSALVYRNRVFESQLGHLEPKDFADIQLKALTEDLMAVQGLLLGLWLVKDNAAFQDRGWIGSMIGFRPFLSNNAWQVHLSNSDGLNHSVNFSESELRIARKSIIAFEGDHLQSTGKPTMLISDSLRFQRFLYFIQAARSTNDVAIKLALYCSAMEALVSTAQTELSRQVAERVASLLELPGPSRVDVFTQVKEAYGYRSKAVHGAAFKGKQFDRLKESARIIDNFCRRLAGTYIDKNSGISNILESGEEEISAFFARRVLGGS